MSGIEPDRTIDPDRRDVAGEPTRGQVTLPDALSWAYGTGRRNAHLRKCALKNHSLPNPPLHQAGSMAQVQRILLQSRELS
jgi:hypothetical protein